MNKITYRLGTWIGGSQWLVQKELGVDKALAFRFRGVWELCGDQPMDGFHGEVEDITEEEAAMILFQCGEPV